MDRGACAICVKVDYPCFHLGARVCLFGHQVLVMILPMKNAIFILPGTEKPEIRVGFSDSNLPGRKELFHGMCYQEKRALVR